MPSQSEKQARTMRAAAHDKAFADRMGIDQEVAREFVRKDEEERGENSQERHHLDEWIHQREDSSRDD